MVSAGRPRDPEVSDAALSAALRLLVEVGYAALTMDRIADRAGVSKASLYRRWPNKLALVVDAARSFAGRAIPVPDTGRLDGDVLALMNAFLRQRRDHAALFDAIHAALESDAELARRCRAVLMGTVARSFSTIVERSVARGELPAHTDVELLAALVPALVRYRRLTTGERPDARFVQRVVGQFFSGVGVGAEAGTEATATRS